MKFSIYTRLLASAITMTMVMVVTASAKQTISLLVDFFMNDDAHNTNTSGGSSSNNSDERKDPDDDQAANWTGRNHQSILLERYSSLAQNWSLFRPDPMQWYLSKQLLAQSSPVTCYTYVHLL